MEFLEYNEGRWDEKFNTYKTWSEEKQWETVNNLTHLWEWMAEQGNKGIVKYKKIRATKGRRGCRKPWLVTF